MDVLAANGLGRDKGLGPGNDLAQDNGLQVGGREQLKDLPADDRAQGNDPVAGAAAATLWEISDAAEAPTSELARADFDGIRDRVRARRDAARA